MAKSFKDVVQDSSGTGLGLPVKTKKPLSRTNTPSAEAPFAFKIHRRFLLALVIAALHTPIEFPRFHHQGDE